MCMIAAGVTKDFGVLACDSAQYDTGLGQTSFETPKLLIIGNGALSFIGTHLYFANLDKSKLMQPFDAACLYLKEYLLGQRPIVEAAMKEGITDPDEQNPSFCLFYLGYHGGHPTVAQFNSYRDFVPVYLWSSDSLKFSTVLYGDDSDKARLFKESKEYMELKAKQLEPTTPGVVAEILTRGIYRKADEEMKIGLKKKYAGGVVNAAMIDKAGIRSLSGAIYG